RGEACPLAQPPAAAFGGESAACPGQARVFSVWALGRDVCHAHTRWSVALTGAPAGVERVTAGGAGRSAAVCAWRVTLHCVHRTASPVAKASPRAACLPNPVSTASNLGRILELCLVRIIMSKKGSNF